MPPARDPAIDARLIGSSAPGFGEGAHRDPQPLQNRRTGTAETAEPRQLEPIDAHIEAIDREQATLVDQQQRRTACFDILPRIAGVRAVSALAMLINMPELCSIEAT